MRVGKAKRQGDRKGGIVVFIKMRYESYSSGDCISREEKGTDVKDVVKN